MSRHIKFHEAILEATDQVMELDPRVYIMGLGVPDPKGTFGTTLGLQKKYGENRVMDMPTSENAMTGIAIGSAIVGMRPIMTHQRVDFFLLALDQLINNAAKWHYMFGGKMQVPLVIRLIIGRGWGQGPQHSQTLHNIFAHIPGLKVVMPSTPFDAKGLLVASVEDNNPVVFIEHRWLHGIFGEVPEKLYEVPLGKAKVIKEGTDVTLVACSQMTLEAWKAANALEKEGISAEVVDLRTIKPLDKETVLDSVRKTGRLVVCDPDWKTCGLAAEVIAFVTEEAFGDLKSPPVRITYPDSLSPTSWMLANHYYPTSKDIEIKVLEIMHKSPQAKLLLQELLQDLSQKPHDVPDNAFTGPF
ncbi:MAG: alpha-ketoacid dehydrogenase subunit beta [Chlamydiales bacterium]|nr:alpha-ketoacid dehydrogenase subunit beta [Chlamydiales bacterium]